MKGSADMLCICLFIKLKAVDLLLICVCTVSLMLLKWHEVCSGQLYFAVSRISGYVPRMSYGKHTLSTSSSEAVVACSSQKLGHDFVADIDLP